MKHFIFPALSFLVIVVSSCRKEPDLQSTEAPVSNKVLGKWLLGTRVEQCYQPTNNLVSEDIEEGLASDSLVFKKDSMVYVYSEFDGPSVQPYKILNEQTIEIGAFKWKIGNLTSNEFSLYSEETDAALNTRNVVKLNLKR
jgi:hypothetical protein